METTAAEAKGAIETATAVVDEVGEEAAAAEAVVIMAAEAKVAIETATTAKVEAALAARVEAAVMATAAETAVWEAKPRASEVRPARVGGRPS